MEIIIHLVSIVIISWLLFHCMVITVRLTGTVSPVDTSVSLQSHWMYFNVLQKGDHTWNRWKDVWREFLCIRPRPVRKHGSSLLCTSLKPPFSIHCAITQPRCGVTGIRDHGLNAFEVQANAEDEGSTSGPSPWEQGSLPQRNVFSPQF